MKLYEQLCFDLLQEYQANNMTTNFKPKTVAVTEILKKANITDQNIIKAITDVLETEDENSNTPENTSTPTTGSNLIPSKEVTSGIKS